MSSASSPPPEDGKARETGSTDPHARYGDTGRLNLRPASPGDNEEYAEQPYIEQSYAEYENEGEDGIAEMEQEECSADAPDALRVDESEDFVNVQSQRIKAYQAGFQAASERARAARVAAYKAGLQAAADKAREDRIAAYKAGLRASSENQDGGRLVAGSLARRELASLPAETQGGGLVRIQEETPGFLAERRRRGFLRMAIVYAIFVGLPTLLGFVYYGLIASDMYVSETRLTVRDASAAPVGGGLEALVGHGLGASTSQNTRIVAEYFESREAVNKLQSMIGLASMFQSPLADWLSRLSDDATPEDLHEYYQDVTDIQLDDTVGILTVRVRAFSPENALTIARSLVVLGDDLVNGIADTARHDAVAFALDEVGTAEDRLKSATDAINNFQIERGQIDPLRSASDNLGVIADLEGKLASARAELAQKASFMRDDSPAVVTLKSRVEALRQQVEEQRARLVGEGGDQTEYPRIMGDFQKLKTEFDLAEKGYVSAVSSLEAARLQAQRKQLYLVPFIMPTEATEPEYPRRAFTIFSIFVAANLVLGILALIYAAIREHASF